MRIYYQGPDALVTDTHFVWRSNPPRSFVISQLHNVRLVRPGMNGSRLALVSVGAAVLLLIPGWFLIGTTIGRVGLIGAAFVAVSLATLMGRTVRRWELRAGYRERDTTLYSTPDLRTFNQVTRALRRAVEATPRTRSDHRAAAA